MARKKKKLLEHHTLKIKDDYIKDGKYIIAYKLVFCHGQIEFSRRFDGFSMWPDSCRYVKFEESDIIKDFGKISFYEFRKKYPEYLI